MKRQNSFFQADDKYDGELEPLRSVQREQGDAIRAWITEIGFRGECYSIGKAQGIMAACLRERSQTPRCKLQRCLVHFGILDFRSGRVDRILCDRRRRNPF